MAARSRPEFPASVAQRSTCSPSLPLFLRGGQTLFDLRRRQAMHADHFVTAGLTGGYGNRRTRNSQKFCTEADTRLVGFALDGRCGERNFECVTNSAGNGVLLGAGMDFHAECRAGSGVTD